MTKSLSEVIKEKRRILAEIEESRKTVIRTGGDSGSPLAKCAEVSVTVTSMKQIKINVAGLRDFVNALNAAGASQEVYIGFNLTGPLSYLVASWNEDPSAHDAGHKAP